MKFNFLFQAVIYQTEIKPYFIALDWFKCYRCFSENRQNGGYWKQDTQRILGKRFGL